MSANKNIIYTIGHSNHTIEHFIDLLKQHGINMVVDVRSVPYSRYCDQFDKEILKYALETVNIRYEFFGKELGARPVDTSCYKGGCLDFHLAACMQDFKDGIARVMGYMTSHTVVVMCTEKEPLECHRTILISRYLKVYQLSIKHILEDGELEKQPDAERRLVRILKIEPTLFEPDLTEADLIERAYEKQSHLISHRREEAKPNHERV